MVRSRYKYVELKDNKWLAVITVNRQRIEIGKYPRNESGERMAHEAAALRLRQERNRQLIDAVCREIAQGNILPEDKYRLVSAITDKVVRQKPDINLINDIVCEHFGLTFNDLANSSRRRKVREPRQIAMYLMREFNHTCQSVGKYYDRDHTTVVHTHRLIRNSMDVDNELVITVKSLEYKIAATDTLRIMDRPKHIGVMGVTVDV